MIIVYHQQFKKHFVKRIKPHQQLLNKYNERMQVFLKDTNNKVLKDHSLAGDLKGFRSFSITGNVRVIYYLENYCIYFFDIGTHNQVYR